MSFDEQPDGDIHGECAAEINRLEQWQNEASAMPVSYTHLDVYKRQVPLAFRKYATDFFVRTLRLVGGDCLPAGRHGIPAFAGMTKVG